jgi:ParB/RepB/Spo0J family partition protein
MTKKILRTTISHMDKSSPLQGQPSRDHAALILPIAAVKLGENIRKDLGNLDELAASIAEHGILQPLVIAKTTRGLELVAGYRRLEAAKLAGLFEVPARIVGADDNQISVLRLVENIMRENLTGLEEIRAVAGLVLVFNGNQDELARAIGKSKSYVSKCIKAAAAVKDMKVSDPKLSLSMLFELAYAPDPIAALNAVTAGEVTSSKDVRKPSGPVHGGRYVMGAIQFRENQKTQAFSLRINFDPERTPSATKEELVRKLQEILNRLRDK